MAVVQSISGSVDQQTEVCRAAQGDLCSSRDAFMHHGVFFMILRGQQQAPAACPWPIRATVEVRLLIARTTLRTRAAEDAQRQV